MAAGAALLAVVLPGCRDRDPRADTDDPTAPPPSTPVAEAPGGMVVSGSRYATEAGRRMLAAGGNAVDAAVAAAFALAVAEPSQSGLGGRTQMLVHAPDGTTVGLDGTTEVPAGYPSRGAPEGEHGHPAVAIPGTVAALTEVQRRYGTLPLDRVMQPAREWARSGVVLGHDEAERLAGLVDADDADAALVAAFSVDGRGPAAGDRLVQPDLAGVLDAISRDGAEAFYRGEVAEAMARDMGQHGGYVTLDDLAGYRAADSEVGRGRYRGFEVRGTYLPASGVTVVEILQILDRLQLSAEEDRRALTLAAALEAGFEDRETAEEMEPALAVAWLTSDSLADRRSGDIGASAGPPPAPRPEASEAPFTTHISVADTLGWAVALTQSLGPTGGARVVTPGLGFLYASTLGGYLAGGGPGYRPWSSQAPTLVLDEGRPWLVMGGAGARRIVSALVGTVTRMVDGGMDLEAALAAPRIHPTGGRILVEEGWGGADGLRSLGREVDPRERDYFARLNVVEVLPDGRFRGAGDPRWSESSAAGPGAMNDTKGGSR